MASGRYAIDRGKDRGRGGDRPAVLTRRQVNRPVASGGEVGARTYGEVGRSVRTERLQLHRAAAEGRNARRGIFPPAYLERRGGRADVRSKVAVGCGCHRSARNAERSQRFDELGVWL